MRNRVEERFSDFYEKWMGQLEEYMRLLLVTPRENPEEASYEAVVSKFTTHHKEFYKFKWASAQEDVLAFFTPAWLTPLENAYLWVTGWKPSMAFRLVESLKKAQSQPRGQMQVTSSGTALAHPGSLAGMTEDQARKIDELRVKIKAEEQRVEREMERQQVGMADRKMVELARLESLVKKNGDTAAASQVSGLVEAALKGLLAGLEKVMKMADCVRLKTLKGVLDVLNPIQCVDFLAATSMLQLQMRKWGRSREKCCNDNNKSENKTIV